MRNKIERTSVQRTKTNVVITDYVGNYISTCRTGMGSEKQFVNIFTAVKKKL